MKKLTATELESIETAIHSVELKTSGEIVVSIIPSSAPYVGIQVLLGVLGWIVGSGGALICAPWNYSPIDWFGIQFSSMGFFWILGQVPSLKRQLLGKSTMASAVHERARKIFWDAGLTETRERTGILILVSLFEHRVEILADKGINDLVGPEFWKTEVEHIIAGVRKRRLAPALVSAVESIGLRLAKHFPRGDGDTNELPNSPRTGD